MQLSPNGAKGSGIGIRPAASTLVLRESDRGLEVLVLKRSKTMRFLPGYLAFPGGAVDAKDADTDKLCSAGRASKQGEFSEDSVDEAYRVAAIRECAEETGILCAVKGIGSSGLVTAEKLSLTQHRDLLAGHLSFSELLAQRKVCLSLSELKFVGRWVTPPGMPARFDTRFFLYILPSRGEDFEIFLSEEENEWVRWDQPQSLLQAITDQTEQAMVPTVAMLKILSTFSSISEYQERFSAL